MRLVDDEMHDDAFPSQLEVTYTVTPMDTRLTHQRIIDDRIKPFLIDKLDLILGIRDYWGDKLSEALDDDVIAERVFLCVIIAALIVLALTVIVATNT